MASAAVEAGSAPIRPTFDFEKHARFFRHFLHHLPAAVEGFDSNRQMLLYFCLSGLDVIGALEKVITVEEANQIIEWMLACQITELPFRSPILPKLLASKPELNRALINDQVVSHCGFRPGPWLGHPFVPHANAPMHEFDTGHIAMTYSALCVLQILTTAHYQPQQAAAGTATTAPGGDVTHQAHSPLVGRPLRELVDAGAICRGVRALQLENGSFRGTCFPSESDMRFVFCACAIASMLGDWSCVDIDRATDFIVRSQAFDGGFAQEPGLEAHGGSTYCAVAALYLMGRLNRIGDRERLVQWLLARQVSGFQGRVNKDPDSCYSWWIGGALHMLGAADQVDARMLVSFIECCQNHDLGGFSKHPDTQPDVLHGYFSLAGIALYGPLMEDGGYPLRALDPALGITTRAAESLPRVLPPSS
ncbi:putative Geranylgeranyl transferase type-1 subunit beta [Paratrimastix pyriformis]|uniref:Geranylgeranyl transferase type-1 subunit beta n=1 Tax=Paratrimastix pyriformis TaxID=342808 RepID=A0ABQ8ULS1_9EUKA|nr:putative Geranylgeranyl transferase type-1 subunit beta [Paratrimastix pyriformis]